MVLVRPVVVKEEVAHDVGLAIVETAEELFVCAGRGDIERDAEVVLDAAEDVLRDAFVLAVFEIGVGRLAGRGKSADMRVRGKPGALVWREDERRTFLLLPFCEQVGEEGRDGQHVVGSIVEPVFECVFARTIEDVVREQVQVAIGLRAGLRVEAVVRDALQGTAFDVPVNIMGVCVGEKRIASGREEARELVVDGVTAVDVAEIADAERARRFGADASGKRELERRAADAVFAEKETRIARLDRAADQKVNVPREERGLRAALAEIDILEAAARVDGELLEVFVARAAIVAVRIFREEAGHADVADAVRRNGGLVRCGAWQRESEQAEEGDECEEEPFHDAGLLLSVQDSIILFYSSFLWKSLLLTSGHKNHTMESLIPSIFIRIRA